MVREHMAVGVASLLLAASAAGCGDDGADSGVTLTLFGGSAKTPLAGAVVSIEEGGIYLVNPDPSKGNPSYRFGGQADASGTLHLSLPAGEKGAHVFANGFRYAPKRFQVEDPEELLEVGIVAAPVLAEDVLPTLSEASLEPAEATPGQEVVVRVTAATSNPDDPLSEETIAVLPASNVSFALDPPSAGVQGVGFPDGEYTRTFSAPSEPGSYAVIVTTTTEHCITSEAVTLTLTVK